MRRLMYSLLMTLWVLNACDVVEGPYIESISTNTDNTETYVQKVLIEDFTGHRCGNCPRAHEALTDLIDIYGDQVVPISYHAGFYAQVIGDYTTDYTSEAGDEYFSYFGIESAGTPNGLVNRRAFSGSVIAGYAEWPSAVYQMVQESPAVGIQMQPVVYNTDTRLFSVAFDFTFLQQMDEELAYTIYLTEDSVLSLQTDYEHDPKDIEHYAHMFMCRKALTPVWGVSLGDSFEQGDQLTENLSASLEEAYEARNCYLVLCLSRVDSKEVLQVEKIALLP